MALSAAASHFTAAKGGLARLLITNTGPPGTSRAPSSARLQNTVLDPGRFPAVIPDGNNGHLEQRRRRMELMLGRANG